MGISTRIEKKAEMLRKPGILGKHMRRKGNHWI
jgi:hypothetical protein